MISPLASSFRGGFRNLTPMRGRGRGGVEWSPVNLSPYAWGDVHAGGTSTTIADKSGNGRADATCGASTAAPLYLPYTGTAYLHLEAAGAGTNSLSCTAPANTASYAAYPLGGGAATTGAAASGAFSFTTAGDWTQVDLLNGSGTPLASYRASDSGQTGHTDAYSVAWSVNRGTAGRKSVVLSPSANSIRSVALLGTNDIINAPAAWTPPATAGTACTVAIVFRAFATSSSSGSLFSTRASNTSVPGLELRWSGTTSSLLAYVFSSAGSLSNANLSASTHGQIHVAGVVTSGSTFTSFCDGVSAATAARSGNDETGTSTMTIGSRPGSGFVDVELLAVATFAYALSADQLALLGTYYRTGA